MTIDVVVLAVLFTTLILVAGWSLVTKRPLLLGVALGAVIASVTLLFLPAIVGHLLLK